MINKVILLGNMTADPEIRTTTSAKEVCRFSIALNGKNSIGDKTVDYVNCCAWEELGTRISRYFLRGDTICVVGVLKFSKYKTKHGDNAVSCYVDVKEFSFCGSGKNKSTQVCSDISDEPEALMPGNEDDLPF